MKIVYNKLIPIKGFSALNFFGLIFARKEFDPLSAKTVNHESIHTKQMREMAYVFFYLWYFVEWIIHLIRHRHKLKAYLSISFEKEARKHKDDYFYPKNRKHYAWIKFL